MSNPNISLVSASTQTHLHQLPLIAKFLSWSTFIGFVACVWFVVFVCWPGNEASAGQDDEENEEEDAYEPGGTPTDIFIGQYGGMHINVAQGGTLHVNVYGEAGVLGGERED
ncbi:hypothetical protein BKA58DRAFT_402345 [Alternaria rosae]|uniref:uncharacterized protein n=1 Tax=Alternaria rosae TaxID=1187941 RepID=UPI001E8D064A|nr:uncharacterized protein BKA58DRAFT_402345 [Alternaria rosae]KAH6867923.1 hypothetical protein BKA58DRAFT_402345 [Alternaria rosae]